MPITGGLECAVSTTHRRRMSLLLAGTAVGILFTCTAAAGQAHAKHLHPTPRLRNGSSSKIRSWTISRSISPPCRNSPSPSSTSPQSIDVISGASAEGSRGHQSERCAQECARHQPGRRRILLAGQQSDHPRLPRPQRHVPGRHPRFRQLLPRSVLPGRIEVLQGPSSILFGRGSTGGVINQASKMPTLRQICQRHPAGGTDLTRRATVDMTRRCPELGERLRFVSTPWAMRRA